MVQKPVHDKTGNSLYSLSAQIPKQRSEHNKYRKTTG